MEEIGDYIHINGILPVGDRFPAQPRRRGRENGNRSGRSPATDPKETEAAKFARQLAEVLKQGLEAHHYESLELMAPPHFLGLLRKSLDQQVSKRVTASFDQDFTGLEQ